jgi:hypothetical protein
MDQNSVGFILNSGTYKVKHSLKVLMDGLVVRIINIHPDILQTRLEKFIGDGLSRVNYMRNPKCFDNIPVTSLLLSSKVQLSI